MGILAVAPLSSAKRIPAQTQNIKGVVKVKFALCLITPAPRYEDILGSGVTAPLFFTSELDGGLVNFTQQTLYSRGRSPRYE
jgi:hypothetical protein